MNAAAIHSVQASLETVVIYKRKKYISDKVKKEFKNLCKTFVRADKRLYDIFKKRQM